MSGVYWKIMCNGCFFLFALTTTLLKWAFDFLSVTQTGDVGYIASGYSSALFKTDAFGDLDWYFSSSNGVADVLARAM